MRKIPRIDRSENMRRIKSQDTKPEMLLRRALYALGLRYQLHAKELPGKPDLVFIRARVVVLVHGCFWHRHPNCREASRPRSRSDYWEPKLSRNVARDQEHKAALECAGFRVIILWECNIENNLEDAVQTVRFALTGGYPGKGGKGV